MPSFAIRLRTTDSTTFSRTVAGAGLRAIGPAPDGIVETDAGVRTLSDEFIVMVEADDAAGAVGRLRDTGARFELTADPERIGDRATDES
jgi:hypothetical protein